MKLRKEIKKYMQVIRPWVDIKYHKVQKEKRALKDLLHKLKKRCKKTKLKLTNPKLSTSKRKELEQELLIIKKQRLKGLKILKKAQTNSK